LENQGEEGHSVVQFWRPSWLYLKDEKFVKQKLENELIPKLKEIQKQQNATNTQSNQSNQSTTTTSSSSSSTTTTPSKKRKQDEISN